MANFDDERNKLELEIVDGISQCIPSNWNEAIVDIRFQRSPNGDTAIPIMCKVAPARTEIVKPSEKLMENVRKMQLLLDKHGEQCERLIYTMVRTPGSAWDFFGECFTPDKA